MRLSSRYWLTSRTAKRQRWHETPAAARRVTVGGAVWWALGLLLAVLITVPAWLPWTDPDLNLLWEVAKGTDDAKHHMLRLFLLGWLVQHGDWYPRWVPDLFMGYGYPVFNYYAPGSYYAGLLLGAVLRLDVWDAYRATGVLAAVLGAGGIYVLVVSIWRRPGLGLLSAAMLLYGPYVFQTNLFQRGAVPEALGLGLLPWVLWCIWRQWRARGTGQQTVWLCLLALAGAALILTHTLVAVLGLVVAGAWTAALALTSGGAGAPGAGRRLALAALAAAGLSAFFWLPAAGESGAVQLEIGREGHLDYREWLLDLGGAGEKQRSPENRQSPAGLLDLHLHYPHQHQFIVTLKPSLAQGVLFLLAVAGVVAGARRPATRPAALLAVPFLAVAALCWTLLFTFSEPLWRIVPAISLMQWPSRLLGPFGICVAVAGAGGLAALLEILDRRAGPGRPGGLGRLGSTGLTTLAVGVVLFNSLGDREVPRLPDPRQPMDGRMVVLEEKDSFSHIGTTSGGEFTPRDVQIATYTAGQRRGRSVFERLYPEREWIADLFQPLQGDLRLLGWRSEPLKLSLRVANDAEGAGRIGIRQFRFPGWRAWVDGRRTPVDAAPYVAEQQAALGFVVLSVPPGEHTINLAFGPTPTRLAGMGLTLMATGGLVGLAAWNRWRGDLAPRIPMAMFLVGCLVLVGVVTYATWRGVRPAFGRFAVASAQPAAPTGGVWGATGLPENGGGLVVNLAEATRTGQARISSPSGATLGRDRFVDVRPLTVVDPDVDRGIAGTSRREWLYLHPPSSVSVDVMIPAGRTVWLQSTLALDPQTWSAPSGDGVRFRVTVVTLDDGREGPPTLVLDRPLNPRSTAEQRRWEPVEVDLSPWGGKTVRLTLSTDPGEDLTFDWAGWGDPVVVVQESARVRLPSG